MSTGPGGGEADDSAQRRRRLIERRLRGGAAARPAAAGRGAGESAAELPLSSGQERLWFLDRLVPGSPVCNVTRLHRLRGPLDVALLARGLTEIVRRHDVLRTVFRDSGGSPVQVVMPPVPMELDPVDMTGDDAERRSRILAEEEARRPFALGRDRLVRARLLRLGTEDHQLVLTVHHIASDAWSLDVLTRELGELYGSRTDGRPAALPRLDARYADYVREEREWLGGPRLEPQLRYWRRRLGGDLEHLDFPWDRPRPPLPTFAGGRVLRRLPRGLDRDVEALSRAHGATLFTALLAGFLCVLQRHTGQGGIAVGTPVARRGRREFEPLIGLFLNTLVLRPDLGGDPSFVELLGRARREVIGAYEHQELPFERLVHELGPSRDLSRNPLFQAMFLLRHGAPAGLRLPGLDVSGEEVWNGTAKFDLTLTMETSPAGLLAGLEYRADLLEPSTAERFLQRLERLLQWVVRHPRAPVGGADLLGAEERPRLTASSGSAAPRALIHQLVEAQARCAPGAPAVCCEGEVTTRAQLDGRADRLGRALRAAGVGPERLVAVLLPRSPALVTAMLAVLKAGGAYLALDPEHPDARLVQVLRDSGAELLLTGRSLRDRLPPGPWAVHCLDDEQPAFNAEPGAAPARPAPDRLAYVAYTSGSTGRPRGVMAVHAGVVNALAFWARAYAIGPGDVVLQLAPSSFDASVRDTLGPLAAGAQVVIGPTAGDPDGLLLAIERHGVTCLLSAVPSVVRALLDRIGDGPPRCPSLRLLMVSGETLTWQVASGAAALLGTALRVVNLYGPTECTMTCTHHPVGKAEPAGGVPIGEPIANTRLHVLDAHLRPVPPGVAGELYIAGAGVSRGYLRQPGLTAERFLPDPFDARPGSRMYRTGDRVRGLSGSGLVHLGRLDRQVKVRGVRVEPEEVEALVSQHPAVREAVVSPVADDQGDTTLAAYVVGRDRGVSAAELRSFLASRLPPALVPSQYVSVDRLPLTASGKVDRSRLPRPAPPSMERPAASRPRDAIESDMVELWEEVLDRRPIGISEDFFTIGGHSLKAVVLMDRIRRRFAVDLPLTAVFQSPCVAGLCDRVRAGARLPADGCLVRLLPGTGRGGPLFLVHPQSGDVACYLPLVGGLGADRAIFGLQAVGLSGDEPPLTSMEAMVRRYVTELRSVEPRGPYRLAGWSFGGNLAFEMARRLESLGAEVAFLGLFDARALVPGPPPATSASPAPRDAAGATRRPAAPETVVAAIRRAAAGGEVPASWDAGATRGLVRVFERNGSIGERHVLTGTVRTDIHLYLARERAAMLPTPEVDVAAWRRLTRGRLHVRRVSGSHYDLVSPPHAAGLARTLRRALDGARRGPEPQNADHAAS